MARTRRASLLQLIWLASPALPIGGFSYSEGLEAAVERAGGYETSAADWLVDQLHTTLARGDLAVVARPWPAWRARRPGRMQELNDWVLQTRETSELRQQTEQMGRSLLDWLRNQDGPRAHGPTDALAAMHPTTPWPLPWRQPAPRPAMRDALLAYAFGWAENMVQAASRPCHWVRSARPAHPGSGWRPRFRLAVDHAWPERRRAVRRFRPMLAILSAQHETQYSRLFRS
jgi:urease accessory protein